MKKSEIITAVMEKTGQTKKAAEKVIDAALDIIAAEVANGGKVQLIGFGTFEVRERSARTGRNPKTKEVIDIPATKIPAFKASKTLKQAVAVS